MSSKGEKERDHRQSHRLESEIAKRFSYNKPRRLFFNKGNKFLVVEIIGKAGGNEKNIRMSVYSAPVFSLNELCVFVLRCDDNDDAKHRFQRRAM